jgi:hypothetical protein
MSVLGARVSVMDYSKLSTDVLLEPALPRPVSTSNIT